MATMKMVPPKDYGGFSHGGVEVKLEADGTLNVPPALYDQALSMGYKDYVAPPEKAPAKAEAFDLATAKGPDLVAFAEENKIVFPADVTKVADMRAFITEELAKRAAAEKDKT